MFIEIESVAKGAPLARTEEIVCISAIDHKVTTRKLPVNSILGGYVEISNHRWYISLRFSQFAPSTLKRYLNGKAAVNQNQQCHPC
jgi:hypothetical protein